MIDHDVPVRTSLPARHYRPLYELAQKNGTTVAALVREIVRRGLESPSAPRGAPRRRTVMTAEHDERIRQLHAEGLNDMQISRTLGIGKTTAGIRRRQMGLPGKPPGRPRTNEAPTDHQEVDA